MSDLTLTELQRVDEKASVAIRAALTRVKPDLTLYLYDRSRATHLIGKTLQWAKVFVLVIAIFAGLASSIRTVQATSEIYAAAGSHPIGVVLAALAFTISVEGALFLTALAQEGEHLKRRTANLPRHVVSLRSLGYGILVRIGIREPLRYDQLPEGGGMGLVMAIAFAFAVAANAYMGFRPLLLEIGSVSLQQFFATLWSSPAHLQLTFILDLAGIVFPPVMALSAGHLTARFAAETAEESQSAKRAFEQDMAVWRQAYANPLETEEGMRLRDQLVAETIQAKAARKAKRQGDGADFLAAQPLTNGTER
jgi:hypothetical protein